LTAQIVRCGTSCGANYEEARAAESKRDFTHKLGIVLKELRECRYWILLVSRAQIVKPERVAPLLDECEQLCAIIGKSLVTARERRRTEE
jgi:four helix bundle protein